MHFNHPQIFIFLLIIPIFLYFAYRRKQAAVLIPVFEDLKRAQSGKWSKILRHANNFLIILMISLFVFAIARPQIPHQKEDFSKKGIDIIVAMDVSGSMTAEDLKPNRITAAKQALKKFISFLSDDRLGMIVFSGVAFTQSPLTFDYNILADYIERISTDSIDQNVRGLSGTAIGDAILAAVNRFKQSEDRTKVLVLLTDGNANSGADPELAAKKAAAEGIKIYTIGIGSEEGAPMPTVDAMGNKTYARNRDGSLVIAAFDEAALKKIAAIGGGRYFRADNDNSFDQAMAEINSLEKRDIRIKKTTEYSEMFYPFLVGLFAVFLLFLGLNYRVVKY